MKVRADQIKHALSKRHDDDFFCTEVKNGPSYTGELLIMDALAMRKSWANPCISAYEIKVSRSDFQKDQKWPGYLKYCNQFSFVCPKGLIDQDELPAEVGLIYYNPEKQTLYTKRKAKHRLIDPPVDLYIYLLMSRIESDRHPFFTNRREFIQAYLNDKENRRRLAFELGSKMSNEIKDMDDELRDLQFEVNRMRKKVEQMDKLQDMLRKYGIRPGPGWMERVEERISIGVDEKLKSEFWNMKRAVNRLQEMVDPEPILKE